jgi:hypothetical protein
VSALTLLRNTARDHSFSANFETADLLATVHVWQHFPAPWKSARSPYIHSHSEMSSLWGKKVERTSSAL